MGLENGWVVGLIRRAGKKGEGFGFVCVCGVEKGELFVRQTKRG